jgi:transcription elongation factor Elf1
MGRKVQVTFEDFKARFDAIHKGALTLVSYQSTSRPITFNCPVHGLVAPKSNASSVITSKVGCLMCAKDALCVNSKLGVTRVDFDTYKARFDKVNEGKVGLLSYVSMGTSIQVLCPTHGEQTIRTANQALTMPVACPVCSGGGRLTFERAKARFDEIHQGRLMLIKFTGTTDPLVIGCPKHGLVEVATPYAQFMARKRGCPKCGAAERNKEGINRKKAPNAP